MKYVKTALLALVIVCGVLFGIANQQPASIHFLGLSSGSCPLYLQLFCAFVAGTTLAFAFNLFSANERKSREKKAYKEFKELKKTYLDTQKNQRHEDESGEHPPSLAEEK